MDIVTRLVDSEFVGRLLGQSFEMLAARVDEAVSGSTELFGGGKGVDVRTLGTFAEHALVANTRGEFFRAGYSIAEDGTVTFDNIEPVDVPVYEASSLVAKARDLADTVVTALFKGESAKAQSSLRELGDLVGQGVRLTAESVDEAVTDLFSSESPWHEAVQEHASSLTAFAGVDLRAVNVPKPRFADIQESEDPRHRKVVSSALREARSFTQWALSRLSLARVIDETYTGSGDAMATADYVGFVSDLVEDLEALEGLLGDAVAVAEDGPLPVLGSVYDRVASRCHDIALASVFAEKYARAFVAPKAA